MNYNIVMYGGRLTRDPQLTYLPSQTPVCDFGVATSRKFKKQDGSYGEEKCFMDFVAFGKTADNIQKYFRKGDEIFITGRLKLETWESKEGAKKSKVRVLVEGFQFCGGNKKKDAQPAESMDEPQHPFEPSEDSGIPF